MYSYSTDEEYFNDYFEDIEEAILNGFKANAEADTIWIGEQVPASSFLDRVHFVGENVVERLNDILHDYIGADGDIVVLSKDDMNNLNQIIIDYVKEKGQFKYYGIEEVNSYERKDYQHLLED